MQLRIACQEPWDWKEKKDYGCCGFVMLSHLPRPKSPQVPNVSKSEFSANLHNFLDAFFYSRAWFFPGECFSIESWQTRTTISRSTGSDLKGTPVCISRATIWRHVPHGQCRAWTPRCVRPHSPAERPKKHPSWQKVTGSQSPSLSYIVLWLA